MSSSGAKPLSTSRYQGVEMRFKHSRRIESFDQPVADIRV
jgi:hypothetical protein